MLEEGVGEGLNVVRGVGDFGGKGDGMEAGGRVWGGGRVGGVGVGGEESWGVGGLQRVVVGVMGFF